jgi:hypothetical protein
MNDRYLQTITPDVSVLCVSTEGKSIETPVDRMLQAICKDSGPTISSNGCAKFLGLKPLGLVLITRSSAI